VRSGLSKNASLIRVLVQPIAKNALTILVNLASDQEILKFLAKDDHFIEVLLKKLMVSLFSVYQGGPG
jgi:hypothetical protein